MITVVCDAMFSDLRMVRERLSWARSDRFSVIPTSAALGFWSLHFSGDPRPVSKRTQADDHHYVTVHESDYEVCQQSKPVRQ